VKPLEPAQHRIRRSAFALVEMVGILALVALVVGFAAPRLFDAISESKIASTATSIKSLQSAVAKYDADMGTLFPLVGATGVPSPSVGPAAVTTPDGYAGSLPDALVLSSSAPPANTGAGLWRKFRGPYIADFTTSNPPIGTSMTLNAELCHPAILTARSANFSLASNSASIFSAGTQVVYATYAGVTAKEFEKLDAMLDDGLGASQANRQLWGKVKWNAATGDLLVYIAHK